MLTFDFDLMQIFLFVLIGFFVLGEEMLDLGKHFLFFEVSFSETEIKK